MALGDCQVLHSAPGHNGRRHPAQRRGERGALRPATGQEEGSRPPQRRPRFPGARPEAASWSPLQGSRAGGCDASKPGGRPLDLSGRRGLAPAARPSAANPRAGSARKRDGKGSHWAQRLSSTGGGALTCEPNEPWGATSPLHRPGGFQTRGRFAAELYAADLGRPTWLTARTVSPGEAGLSFP
ncbi:hypothetical protein NN561_009838 [Cricetulus griseus]